MATDSKPDINTPGGSRDQKGLLPVNFVYTWKLESLFSSTPKGEEKWHHSTSFEAGGYRWNLVLHPAGLKAADGKSYWSLFLGLEDGIVLPSHFFVEITLKSSILNQNDKKHDMKKVVYRHQKGKSEVECPFLISLETLKCPSTGFLIVEIINAVVHAAEDGPSFEEEEKKTEYIWKIDGFSKLTSKSYKSGPFLIGGNIWNLILHPKGNQQDEFLSLYLELDNASKLQPSDKVYADFGLTIIDQFHGNNPEKRTTHHFNSKEPDWGFTRFVALSYLHDPSKGFLVNDTCKVKAVFYSSE